MAAGHVIANDRASRILLDVPYERQINDYYCVPASVTMLLRYHGYRADQKAVGKILRTTKESGTHFRKSVEFLLNQNVQAELHAFMTLENIIESISIGIPPIVGVNMDYPTPYNGHAIVIKGYDLHRSCVHINDPQNPNLQRASFQQLRNAWEILIDGEPCNPGILLAPEGYSINRY